MKMSFRIAVDFDNTLFVNEYPEVGPVVPGAARFMKKMKDAGHILLIWTCRMNPGINDDKAITKDMAKIAAKLTEAGIPYDEIVSGEPGKLMADFYIDDHALGCPLRFWKGRPVVDWQQAYNLISLAWVSERMNARKKKQWDAKEGNQHTVFGL